MIKKLLLEYILEQYKYNFNTELTEYEFIKEPVSGYKIISRDYFFTVVVSNKELKKFIKRKRLRKIKNIIL